MILDEIKKELDRRKKEFHELLDKLNPRSLDELHVDISISDDGMFNIVLLNADENQKDVLIDSHVYLTVATTLVHEYQGWLSEWVKECQQPRLKITNKFII